MKSAGNYKIPYDLKGNMLEYPYRECVWVDNTPFQARLTIDHMERGYSAARLIWKNEEDRKFPMFLVDTVDLLQHGSIVTGTTELLTWVGRKRGQNYGVALLNS